MITLGQLCAIMPRAGVRADVYLDALDAAMAQFSIDTPTRVAAFLAQVAHESGELRYTRELATGGAYEGRADLGNVEPGDGPRFRGRGLIQITGRANYAQCSQALYGDDQLLRHPELLEALPAAAISAAWWWQAHGCNALADAGDFTALTRRINGGTNGLASRQAYWAAAKRALPVAISTGDASDISIDTPAEPAPPERKRMDPLTLISVFGPILSNLIPQVAKLFGGGSEVATRNVATASLVLDTVTKAAGAANVQQAVEKMQADPALAASVQAAVVSTPGIMELLEVGGGIDKARTAAADPNQIPYWRNPAFVVAALLMPLVYLVVVGVAFNIGGTWSDEMRSVVVTAIVTGLLGSITGFFLGSSLGSQKKTDQAAAK